MNHTKSDIVQNNSHNTCENSFENNNKQTEFTILAPPPNVNAKLHLGHALTYTIQDFIVRCQKVFFHKNAYLLPGFDHGGIATEFSAQKLGYVTRQEIEIFALNNRDHIREQFEILKLLKNDNYEQYTMDQEHCDFVANMFILLYQKGYIKKRKTLVHFDTKLRTAISDLEVEYIEKDSVLYEVEYLLEDCTKLQVSTQRPETIFADVALAVNPNDERYKHLVGKYVYVPIIHKKIPIITAEEVDINFGTGILKITPAHDMFDYEIAKRYGLDGISLLNEEGDLIYEDFQSMAELKEYIVSELHLTGKMFRTRIPIGRSSKAIIEPLFQEHWFFEVSRFKNEILSLDLKIFPETWKALYESWLNNLKDWCISRTNIWGHSIPIWYNGKEAVASLKSPGENWIKETKTLDTWFSSALWPLSYKNRFNIYPTDVLVTAYDIIFFWVARMVIMSYLIDGTLPFKSVFIHRLICDEEGKKMSKTRGNVIDPITVIDQYGLDCVRHALLKTITPAGKILISYTLLEESKKIKTKYMNLILYTKNIYKPQAENGIIYEHFQYLTNNLYNKCKNAIQKYEIHIIVQEITNFLYYICDWLVEFSKIEPGVGLDLIINDLNILLHPIYSSIEYNTKNTNQGQYHQEIQDLIDLICLIRSLQKSQIKVFVDPNYRYYKILQHMCKGIDVIQDGESVHFRKYNVDIILKNIPIETIQKTLTKQYEERKKFDDFLELNRNNNRISIDIIEEKRQKKQLIQENIDIFEMILKYI